MCPKIYQINYSIVSITQSFLSESGSGIQFRYIKYKSKRYMNVSPCECNKCLFCPKTTQRNKRQLNFEPFKLTREFRIAIVQVRRFFYLQNLNFSCVLLPLKRNCCAKVSRQGRWLGRKVRALSRVNVADIYQTIIVSLMFAGQSRQLPK